MSEDAASSRLCCALDAIPSSERAAHTKRAGQLFGAALIGRTESSDGYEFEFETEMLEELARFVSLERLCCPFLRFVIEIEGEREGVRLRITGPPGSKEVIEAELLQ